MLSPERLDLRHFLVLDIDECATAVCTASYLFSPKGCHLRGAYTRDVCHRLHRNWDLCVDRAGLKGDVYQQRVCVYSSQ